MSVPVPPELNDAAAGLVRPNALEFIKGSRLPRGGRAAAVLILLSESDPGYQVVLIEKRPELRHHAGQVAFPGGRIEAFDADPVAAALREANEEVGVTPGEVSVIGTLPPAHIPRSGFDVTSVVGWWGSPHPLEPGDPGEVAAVHQVPVERLLDPTNRSTWVHPGGFSGPAFEIDDLYVWGFTAFLLDGLFDLLDWTRPWSQSRTTRIPPRFLSDRL